VTGQICDNHDKNFIKVFGMSIKAQEVLVTLSHPACGSCKFEFLAKQPKSKEESRENMPILRFLIFGCLFQFLVAFTVPDKQT